MSTKETANKALTRAYGGTLDAIRAEQDKRTGQATHRPTSIVTEKPGGESHLVQLQREAQARQAENEEAIVAARARRQAREALEQLQAEKQHEWVQAGGTVAEFRQAWPEMRRKHLMDKVAGE